MCACPWVEIAPGAYYLYDIGGLCREHVEGCTDAAADEGC